MNQYYSTCTCQIKKVYSQKAIDTYTDDTERKKREKKEKKPNPFIVTNKRKELYTIQEMGLKMAKGKNL